MDKYILYAVVSICISSTKLKIKVLFLFFSLHDFCNFCSCSLSVHLIRTQRRCILILCCKLCVNPWRLKRVQLCSNLCMSADFSVGCFLHFNICLGWFPLILLCSSPVLSQPLWYFPNVCPQSDNRSEKNTLKYVANPPITSETLSW